MNDKEDNNTTAVGENENVNTNVTTKTALKSGVWYTIANFLTKAIVFLTTPFFTRILSEEQYGNFTVFASWQSILLIICGLEVYSTINRARFDFKSKEEYNAYITTSLTLNTAFTAILFVAFLFFSDYFYKIMLIEKKYMYVMFAYLFTCPAFMMFQSKQRVEYKYKLNTALSFILVVGSSVMAVVMALLIPNDRLFGRILGQYMLYAIAGIIIYIYFVRKSHRINLRSYKYALRIGLPMVFSYLGGQILLSSDNIVVKHMCTSEQVGYLSVTHTCANIIILFVQTLNSAWSPWFFDKLNMKETDTIKNFFLGYIGFVMVATFGIILFAPEIIYFLGGESYREAIYILPVNILCGFFSILTYQFGNLETFNKRTEYAAILMGIVSIMNIGLNIIGVHFWGYQAVCYMTIVSQIVLVLLHYKLTIKMGIRKILPFKYILFGTLIVLTYIPISMILYQYNALRLSLLCILIITIIVGIILKRNKLLQFIKSNNQKK